MKATRIPKQSDPPTKTEKEYNRKKEEKLRYNNIHFRNSTLPSYSIFSC